MLYTLHQLKEYLNIIMSIFGQLCCALPNLALNCLNLALIYMGNISKVTNLAFKFAGMTTFDKANHKYVHLWTIVVFYFRTPFTGFIV